ncbi:unnamed protein product [Cunninghamella blakesleeana]
MEMYPTGLTSMITLNELEKRWEKHCRKKIRSSTYTIDDLYDLDSPTVNVLLEVQIDQLRLMHGSIWMATLKDESSKEMDAYLHPKYNPWINNSISPLITDFIKDRSFRFICPSQINTLITPKSKHNSLTTKLSRSDNIICVATTHEVIWKLKEEDLVWVKEFFTDRFSTVIRPESMVSQPKIHKLWLKVVHVENEEILDDSLSSTQHTKARPTLITNNSISMESNLDKRIRLDIFVAEQPFHKKNDYALISFYDHQIPLAKSIQRGDYIGLYNPLIASDLTESQATQTDLVFECGLDTVLFLLPHTDDYLQKNNNQQLLLSQVEQVKKEDDFWQKEDNNHHEKNKYQLKKDSKNKHNSSDNNKFSNDQQQSNSSETSFIRDDEGIFDCSYYLPKLKIQQLEASMINITLCGRVIAKANNNPYQKNMKWMSRYAIRIEDESGKLDITLWEETGQYAKRIQIGQYILITGLSTTVEHHTDEGVTWFTNGSHLCGTVIYNVSELDCPIISTSFRSLTPLNDIQGEGNWHTEAMIVGWEVHTFDRNEPIKCSSSNVVSSHLCISDYVVALAHMDCLLPINKDFKCNYCSKDQQQKATTYIFRSRQKIGSKISNETGWIEWRLDNGHGILNVYGFEMLLLNCTAEKFKSLSSDTQVKLLDQVIGKQYLFSISCISSRGYRIDKCIESKPNTNECSNLLNEIISPEKQ